MPIQTDAFLKRHGKEILQNAAANATEIIKQKFRPVYFYHDLRHTESVVEVTEQLAKEKNLSEERRIVLGISAWFHDVGYYDRIDGHENIGADHAEALLKSYDCPPDLIETVSSLILQTSIHHSPSNEEAMVLRDADLHYLGADTYFHLADNLRKEWEITRAKNYTDKEWLEQNLRFLSNHSFFTNEAKARYLNKKQENIEELKNRLLKYTGNNTSKL